MCKVTQNLSSIGSYFMDNMVKLEDKLKKIVIRVFVEIADDD